MGVYIVHTTPTITINNPCSFVFVPSERRLSFYILKCQDLGLSYLWMMDSLCLSWDIVISHMLKVLGIGTYIQIAFFKCSLLSWRERNFLKFFHNFKLIVLIEISMIYIYFKTKRLNINHLILIESNHLTLCKTLTKKYDQHRKLCYTK